MATGLLALSAHAQPDPCTVGKWEAPFTHPLGPSCPSGGKPWPAVFNAGHMALIPRRPHRGKVLVWDLEHYQNPSNPAIRSQRWAILDPTQTPKVFLNNCLPLPNGKGDPFCAGQAWTRDGRLYVAGGTQDHGAVCPPNPSPPCAPAPLTGAKLTLLFDATATGNTNNMWTPGPDLKKGRWYPTVLAIDTQPGTPPVDWMLVFGGHDLPIQPNSYEAYDPFTNTLDALGPFAGPLKGPGGFQWGLYVYPHMFLLVSPSTSFGQQFMGMMEYNGARVQHNAGPPRTWTNMPIGGVISQRQLNYGTSFLLPNPDPSDPVSNLYYQDVVVRVGGLDTLTGTPGNPTNLSQFCKASASQAGAYPNGWDWTGAPALQQMAHARYFPNAVILPDGTVLVIGGHSGTAQNLVPVLTPERLVGGQWYPMADMVSPRGEHSVAVLLPDGRVLVGGGEDRCCDYEIYKPPYLFCGTPPVITNPPPGPSTPPIAVSYNQTATVTYQDNLPLGIFVEKVVLIRPGAVTHGFNMDQRYLRLEIVDHTVGTMPPSTRAITFKAPPNSRHAPKGYYMLFLVTNPTGQGANQGTPSQAAWVVLQ
ncbi:MAG: galactose oxidase-like domain-containing protein [Planctomycetota bacterium]